VKIRISRKVGAFRKYFGESYCRAASVESMHTRAIHQAVAMRKACLHCIVPVTFIQGDNLVEPPIANCLIHRGHSTTPMIEEPSRSRPEMNLARDTFIREALPE